VLDLIGVDDMGGEMTPERLAELERLASMPRETCYLDGIDVATVAQDALAEIRRLQAQWEALGDVLPGDVIHYPLYMFGHEYDSEERTVEVFRGCLGVFRSGYDRTAGRFTPLCDLYKPGPGSTQGYISNYGEYQTGPMVPVWTVVSRLERE